MTQILSCRFQEKKIFELFYFARFLKENELALPNNIFVQKIWLRLVFSKRRLEEGKTNFTSESLGIEVVVVLIFRF